MLIPRIAIFPSSTTLFQLINKHFNSPPINDYYSLRYVKSVREILELIEDEQDSFDAIMLPYPLELKAEPSDIIEMIRASELLSATAIVAVCDSSSLSSNQTQISNIFADGSDLCLELPYPENLLYQQLAALSRFHRQVENRIIKSFESAGLRRSTIAALNSCTDPLLLIDKGAGITFVNSSARNLLGLSNQSSRQEYLDLERQLQTQLNLVSFDYETSTSERANFQSPTSANANLLTQEIILNTKETQLHLTATITAIEVDSSLDIGYCLTLRDISLIEQFNSLLHLQHNIKHLALNSIGALLSSLPLSASSVPLDAIHELQKAEAVSCSFDLVISGIIQVIDSLIDPSTNLKLNLDSEIKIAIKASDCCKLFLELLISAQQFLASPGEMILTAKKDRQQRLVRFRLEVMRLIKDTYETSQLANLTRIFRGINQSENPVAALLISIISNHQEAKELRLFSLSSEEQATNSTVFDFSQGFICEFTIIGTSDLV